MRRRDLIAGLAIVGTTGSPLRVPKKLLIGAVPDLRVGPRVPVGPEKTAVPPGAVILFPHVDVQGIIDDHPAGTTYFFSEGLYARQSLRPKRGDSYIGARDAVLDGQNATTHAFKAENADGVVIRNLVVQHYAAKAQDAPIRGGKDWIIRKCEIAFNAGWGIFLNGNWEVDACKIHHNLQLGFGGVHDQAPAHIHDCEIAFNNFTDAYSPDWEAGGCKFWESNGAIFEYNWSHDNHGGGVWTDSNNDNFHCHHNLVENNWAGGIAHEIGWSASIHDNIVRNNSSHKYCGGTYLWQGEIEVSASGGLDGRLIEIFNNIVVSNYRGRGSDGLAPANGNAITIVEQQRTDSPSPKGAHLCRDIHVHHNYVDMRKGGLMGAATDWAADAPRMFSAAANIKFEANQYIGAGASTFWWKGIGRDFAGWRALGFDMTGTST